MDVKVYRQSPMPLESQSRDVLNNFRAEKHSSDTIKRTIKIRDVVIPELQQLRLYFGPVVRKLGFPADIPL
ncbi:hypothetical protein WN944_014926 [Citrus x changshan-huyou]|uniref:Uncharacterized protein n=1 Tax=Citrus x changshan-huyou TaxID=2935761 RepID=A0AAP0M6G8_9ROSI